MISGICTAREKRFESIPFGAICFSHKAYVHLSLMVGGLYLLHCFKIYRISVLPASKKRDVKRQNKHKFDR